MGVITTAGVLWIVRLIDRASCDRRATRRVSARAMVESEMRIGELARLVGVSTSALRYYEMAGLVEPADRSPVVTGSTVRQRSTGSGSSSARRLWASP